MSLKGLDVGLVTKNTGGESKGLQWVLVGYVDGDFIGWQGRMAGGAGSDGSFTGLQGPTGVNHAASGKVFQIGLVNTAANMSGFQLSIVNFT